MRDFGREWNRMNRQTNFFFAFVMGWIIIVFLAIISWWVTFGFVGYKIVQDPAAITKTIGEVIGKGVKEYRENSQ